MSKTIDLSDWADLSRSDREYAAHRGMLTPAFCAENGITDDELSDLMKVGAAVPEQGEYTGTVNTRGLTTDQLLAELAARGVVPNDTSVPFVAEGPSKVIGDYSSMTKLELIAELEKRNLDVMGRKADLLERLLEDDAANASTEDEDEEDETEEDDDTEDDDSSDA